MSSIPRSELRHVERAEIYKDGDLAGSFMRTRQGIRFSYDPRYIDAGLPPIATTLPFSLSGMETIGGHLPSFFSNLLPEGVRLLAIRDQVKTSLSDDLSLLLAVGRDCVGDVAVVPEGEDPEESLDEAGPFDVESLFARAQAGDDHTAISGVQEKVSSSMLTFPGISRRGPAIVKLAPPELPNLIQNEHFFLQMARACGIPSAQSEILFDDAGRPALWVDRFDRIRRDQSWARLAQEDGCQLCDEYPARKYAISVRGVAESFARESAAPLVALQNLLAQLAFAYLIGNGDQHAKNLSLGASKAGLMPTPAYDILSTLFYPRLDPHMALKMDGRNDGWKRKSFVAFFGRHAVPERAVFRTLDRLCDQSPAWIARLEEIGFDAPTTDRVRREILRRRQDLAGD